MKKSTKLMLAMSFAAAVMSVSAAAEEESESQAWSFDHDITIVCPWGFGGGADTTIRPMADLLGDILGVKVEVKNVEGNGGVDGLQYAYEQDADGYTYLLGTQSLIMEDLQGNTSMDFKTEFECEDMLVHSINIIAASKASMDKIGVDNWTDLCIYAADNTGEVKAGLLTATGVDGASLEMAIEHMDLQIVNFDSGVDVKYALEHGEADIAICGLDEISDMVEAGTVVPLLALCEERMENYPDVQCVTELAIDSTLGPWRAIFAKNGTPAEATEALVAAIEEARATEDWQAFMQRTGYYQRSIPAAGKDLQKFVEDEYKDLAAYLQEKDALKKDYDAE